MEITLDLPLLRAVLAEESAAMAAEIRTLGVRRAFSRSQQRHDERLAGAADNATLACRAGCCWCCYFTVDVRAVEVFNLVEVVDRTFSAQAKRQLYAEVRANSATLRGQGELERATRNLKCPFLIEGRCSVYAARPQSCRNYHATSAVGCQRSYEQPENQDIDPEFAPGVYQAGGAHVEAVTAALREAGYDVNAYELNGALAAALADPEALQRFEARQQPFPQLDGVEVLSEYDDLLLKS